MRKGRVSALFVCRIKAFDISNLCYYLSDKLATFVTSDF